MSQEGKTFSPGDRVEMISEGASMTVIDVGRHTDLVWCRWATDAGMHEAAFPAHTLKAWESKVVSAISDFVTSLADGDVTIDNGGATPPAFELR